MALITTVTGAVLTVLGAIAYVVTDAASPTALIPSVVGVALLACGVVARRPRQRRPATLTAFGIAIAAAGGSLINVAQLPAVIRGDAERPAAVTASTIMFVVLVCYAAAAGRTIRRGDQ